MALIPLVKKNLKEKRRTEVGKYLFNFWMFLLNVNETINRPLNWLQLNRLIIGIHA